MATKRAPDVVVHIKLPRELYDKMRAHQTRLHERTHIEPSIVEVMRALLEVGLEQEGKRP